MAPVTKIAAIGLLTALAAADCTSPVQRKNWTSLTNNEKLTYLEAEQCLMATDAVFGIYSGAKTLWDEMQYAHQVQSNFIHGVGQFLPWHRYYMTLHERLLQSYCGYTGGVPYWDMAVDSANITLSSVWDTTYGIGGDGDEDTTCVVDGPFANTTLHVAAESYNPVIPKEAEYCLNRTISVSTFQMAKQSNVDACYENTTFSDFQSCLGEKPHTAGHGGTGGTMANTVLSPGDPVFFLHHTNIDRLWWVWQSKNSSRLTDMGGNNTPTAAFNAGNGWSAPGTNLTAYSGDPGNTTTLNHVLWMVGMIPNATIAAIMDIGNETVCAEYV